MDVLRGCVASNHVAEVEYTDLQLTREMLRVRDTGEVFTPAWQEN